MNEVFVQFAVSDKLSSKIPSITINNIGWIQAPYVKAYLTLNNTANVIDYSCIDGNISTHDENTQLIQFDRMSTNLDCTLHFDRTDLKIKEILITSENRSTYIYQLSEIQQISNIILIMLLIASGLLVWVLYTPVIDLYFILGTKLFYRHITKPKYSNEIKEFIRTDFSTWITIFEAIIIKYIYEGKTTTGQLIAKTELDPVSIRFFIKLLRRKELIVKDETSLHPEIKKFLDNIKDNESNSP